MRKMILKVISSALFLAAIAGLGGCGTETQSPALRVAIPYSDNVQDPEQNYYLGWLKEKTGLNLEIITIRQNRSVEYLDTLFSSGADVDVVLFGGDFTITEEELKPFVEAGAIWSPFEERSYYPNYGSTAGDNAGQILWINYDWLLALNLSVPRTTKELEEVLLAFKNNDPNQNGIQDEIPLSGTTENYVFSPVELILNSFVYNDPFHARYQARGENEVQNAATDEFREGLRFCERLYREGLIDENLFTGTLSRLSEFVNSPADLVGAFTTDSISDVIYQGNPEIMAKFIHVVPLAGPEGVRNALRVEKEPAVGAIITGHSTKKMEAELLLDTMMSTEGSLIARFGEEGVDWDYSEGLDVSIYGGVSTIVTKNYIWNTPQNKHLNGIGPMDVPKEYLEGVTWNGVNSDTEYIDARAKMSYREFLPKETSDRKADAETAAVIDGYIRDFITGVRDINSDEEWKEFVDVLQHGG